MNEYYSLYELKVKQQSKWTYINNNLCYNRFAITNYFREFLLGKLYVAHTIKYDAITMNKTKNNNENR